MKENGRKWYCVAGVLVILLVLAFQCTPVQAAKLPSLKVKGTHLVNSKGKTVQLKGVSTHGLSWYPEYVNQKAFTQMKKKWKINTVRLAVYTAEYNGYCTGDKANRKALEKKIDDGVKFADKAGLYIIIDWHILSDGNPRTYEKQSLAFFKKMASKYKNHTNVIYEICNEPNGGTSWDTIKTYAGKVVKAIRSKDKKAVILIGTPTWSQDVDIAAESPLKGYKNLMYTLHFYAGTHGQELRDRIDGALASGLPVFVSEWGTSRADGSGGVFLSQSEEWLDFLDRRGISWANWSLCDKNETSAALRPGTSPDSPWDWEDLSQSGKFVFARFRSE